MSEARSLRVFARSAIAALLCLGGAASAQQRPGSGRTGSFELSSATTGAEVTIDGEKRGVVPLAPIGNLIPGEHTIKIEKPGFAPYIDVFRIERKKPTRLEVQLVPVAGVLRIKANVEAARVYIDGKFAGEVPLVTEIEVGARAVQVSKGGYKDFFQNLSAVAGEEVNLDVVLDELPVGANPYKPPPPPPPRWHQKWWVWTVGALGVGVVVTAVVVPSVLLTRDPTAGYLPVAVHLPSLTLSLSK